MTSIQYKTVANWGNYPKIDAEMADVDSLAGVRDYVTTHEQLIARGNGKCYGDAALAPHILSTLGLNRLLHFDAEQGIIQAEAGLLLADLLDTIVPAGWFFQVTPGIKNITLGGAIASDVHGKNHPTKGCFSNWLLDVELMRADGTVVICSRETNADLFWQTCGGMGWTGVILTARFRLMRIQSAFVRQRALQAQNLEALFSGFETRTDFPYAAAWVDCLSGGPAFGRGVVYLAAHEEAAPDGDELRYPHRNSLNVPFYAPGWLLNNVSIRVHNNMLFRGAKTGEQRVDLDRYFYPLDRIRNWNRLYGASGFVQYQFCLPEKCSFEGIRTILEAIHQSPDTPFLTVLKQHGDRPAEAVHSFPVCGHSLALDFPRSKTLPALIQRLDELVWRYDGRIYLAKDACSAGRMGRVDPSTFGESKFHSLLKGRILQGR